MTELPINLNDYLDPAARYVFLDDDLMTEACSLRGVTGLNMVVKYDGNPFVLRRRKGYFVAAGGKGVVRFEGEMECLFPSADSTKNNLYRLSVIPTTLSSVNRRQFIRYDLQEKLPIYFKCQDDLIKAVLMDISEGGMRLSMNKRLPLQVTHSFDLHLPCGMETVDFKTDGMIVYCEPEDDPQEFVTGVTFLAPSFESEQKKYAYMKDRMALSDFLKKNPACFGTKNLG